VASEKLAAVILFTLPGAPCIYYGDEVGMTGHHDPGSRAGFPWDRPDTWNRELMDAYRSLGRLRRAEVALRRGSYRPLWEEGSLYAYAREHGDDRFVIAVNAGEEAAIARLDVAPGSLQLQWGAGEAVYEEGRLRVTAPARSAGVWRIR
jgi:neopullulanase